jgi:hypothetical protein
LEEEERKQERGELFFRASFVGGSILNSLDTVNTNSYIAKLYVYQIGMHFANQLHPIFVEASPPAIIYHHTDFDEHSQHSAQWLSIDALNLANS